MNSSNNVTKLSTDSHNPSDALNEAEQIRALLLAPEREKISTLQGQIRSLQNQLNDHDTRAHDTSQVLVDAITIKQKRDESLGDALKPLIEEQFQISTRENPNVMAEALFPVLGPALRKMIVNMLTPDSNSVQRGFKFEQLFVIDNETGIPLCHTSAKNVYSQDADMVSGMLSAIQSFVQDAFSTQEFDNLNTLQVGELSVWIEWGPSVVLAVVIRGAAPKSSREALQELNELIHSKYKVELTEYNGDNAIFEPLKPTLQAFLSNHDSRLKNRVRNLPQRVKMLIIGGGALILAFLIWFVHDIYQTKYWNSFVENLDAEPGIVVTSQHKTSHGYEIHGLRDTLAIEPATLLLDYDIPVDSVTFKFEPFHSNSPEFLNQRIHSVLVPPSGVALSIEKGVLHISGPTPHQWQLDAQRLARTFTSINKVVFHKASSRQGEKL